MIKKEELQTLLKNLHVISGFRMSLVDTQYNSICAYPQSSNFCSLIHKNKKASALCIDCDKLGYQEVKKTGTMLLYQCHLGLYEAIFPIYYNDRLAGYLITGQTLSTSKFDKEMVFNRSQRFVEDKEALIKAIDQLVTYTPEKIKACATIIEICATYITLTKQLSSPTPNLPASIKEYLEATYNMAVSLEELEEYFHCSKATLTQTFKKAYDISIHQYLINYRLKKAIELLVETHYTIKEIAHQCGFQDQNYFSKAFTKKYTISPTQYRLEALQAQN